MRRFLLAIVLTSGPGAFATEAPSATTAPAAGPSMNSAALRTPGYLSPATLPSSLSLVPPPPATGSGAMARDEEISRAAVALHGSPRWDLATADSMLALGNIGQTFACALNVPVSEERTPRLATLLRRTLVDAARSTSEAKRRYQRARPFTVNNKPLCTPQDEKVLRLDGSYPSGHAAIGWAVALVLSEVSPEQTNALLARGRAFGQSRVICNAHWQSDVSEGQVMASAVVARLHAEPEFRADVEAARNELAALRAQAPPVDRDCKVEANTLQSG